MTTEDVTRLRNHFTALCADYNVHLCTTCRKSFKENRASVDTSGRGTNHRLCVAPINGPVSYAAAMHELGHTRHKLGASNQEHESRYKSLIDHLDAHGDPRTHYTTWDLELLLIGELSAWEWAVRHSLFWTPEMTRTYRYAIGSYLRGFDVCKDVLPISDRLDAQFQRCTPREAIKLLGDELMKQLTPEKMIEWLKSMTMKEAA